MGLKFVIPDAEDGAYHGTGIRFGVRGNTITVADE